ncbi:MAG: hypothetical protein AB7F53_05210 [Nitrososphaeraceae archaeon]
MAGVEVNNRKDSDDADDDKKLNNNKEMNKKVRDNDIIELLTKGKIELSQNLLHLQLLLLEFYIF